MPLLDFLVLSLIFGLFIAWFVFGFLSPRKASDFSAKLSEWANKLSGYEVSIKTTEKSVRSCKVWSGIYLMLF